MKTFFKKFVIVLRALAFVIFATFLPALIIAFLIADIDIALGFTNFQSVLALIIGLFFVVVGLLFRIWATLAFYNHQLAVLRLTAQSELISSGPYRFTRSPHYIGITLIFLGCAILVGSYVALVAVIPLFIFWNQLLKRYEEPKLAHAFGETYEKYRRSVPRWINSNAKSVFACISFLIVAPLILYGVTTSACPNVQQKLTENKATIDGRDIYYQTAGNSTNAPLIFMHGWGARRDDTCGIGRKNVTAELAKHFNVYSLELPGLIRSEPPQSIWDMEDYGRFLRLFIEEVGIDHPIVMGQSFGGGVATTYAGLYPEDVPYLVLVDASPGKRTKNFYYSLRFRWKPFFDWTVDSRFVPLSFKRTVVSLYLGVPQEAINRENVRKYLVMSDVETTYSVKTDYSLLPMPTLLIWGKDDIYVTPLDRAREIAKEIPNVNLVIIEGGHLALYTNTNEAIQAIINYMPQ